MIQHLLYPTVSEVARWYALFDRTPAAVYTKGQCLCRLCDPEEPSPEDARLDYLLPTDVILTLAQGRNGIALVLDVRESEQVYCLSPASMEACLVLDLQAMYARSVRGAVHLVFVVSKRTKTRTAVGTRI